MKRVFAYHEIVASRPRARRSSTRAATSTTGPALAGLLRLDLPHGATTSIGTGSLQQGFGMREAVAQLRRETDSTGWRRSVRGRAHPARAAPPLGQRPRRGACRRCRRRRGPGLGGGIFYAMTAGAWRRTRCTRRSTPATRARSRTRAGSSCRATAGVQGARHHAALLVRQRRPARALRGHLQRSRRAAAHFQGYMHRSSCARSRWRTCASSSRTWRTSRAGGGMTATAHMQVDHAAAVEASTPPRARPWSRRSPRRCAISRRASARRRGARVGARRPGARRWRPLLALAGAEAAGVQDRRRSGRQWPWS